MYREFHIKDLYAGVLFLQWGNPCIDEMEYSHWNDCQITDLNITTNIYFVMTK